MFVEERRKLRQEEVRLGLLVEPVQDEVAVEAVAFLECGADGVGRLPEPQDIVAELAQFAVLVDVDGIFDDSCKMALKSSGYRVSMRVNLYIFHSFESRTNP